MRRSCCGLCCTLTTLLALQSFSGEGPAPQELTAAIQSLRHIDLKKLDERTRRSKAMAIDGAWETISHAGKAGANALKDELRKLSEAKEQDDFFALGAAALLFELGGVQEALTVAEIWKQAELASQFNYVFTTAMRAAQTRDPKVLPMLEAMLSCKAGKYHMPQQAMVFEWPVTLRFVWETYGHTGLPALQGVLQNSKNPAAQEFACQALAKAQYLPALGDIRKLARSSDSKDVRRAAIHALGFFGHPEDFAFLSEGLKTKDAEDARACVFALWEYGDLRAVSLLLPQLKSSKPALRLQVLGALVALPCPASLSAFEDHAVLCASDTERNGCKQAVALWLKEMKLSAAEYKAKVEGEKELLFESLRANQNRFGLKSSSKSASRDELLAALAEWQKRGRLVGGKFDWLKGAQVVGAATADDLTALLELRASVLARVSDEALYEGQEIDNWISVVGRKRYRKVPGVCARVEAPDK